MPYRGQRDYLHGSSERCGVLVVNLGTPDAPTAGAVRRYLGQFLSDPRVVELPRALWWPLLHGVILPLRSPRSAHAYRTIWSDQGSPLRVESEQVCRRLADRFAGAGSAVEVRLAMRYGSPSVQSVLDDWIGAGLRRLIVLPLYPQYSATTTASVFDAVAAALGRWRWPPELRLINDYHHEARWIDAVAGSVRAHWQRHGRGDRLLFSFHGLPERNLHEGDPYFCQCHASARRIAAALDLSAQDWLLSFQSRVGRQRWLQPYTEQTLAALPAQGVRTLDVVCPGFAADCLETLEEIAIRGAETFRAAGGDTLRYVPALNADDAHVDALAAVLQRHGQGWPEFDGRDPRVARECASEQAAQRANYSGPVG